MNDTKIIACCGFGHRQVFENITEQLESAVNSIADQGCKIFYTGAMGDFDNLFSSAVRKAKANYPDIKLICVKPYMTQDINENGDYLYSLYDDIIIPSELVYVHYKSAITKRNELMIKWSDWVIVYHIHDYGGVYRAELFAKKNQKAVIRIKYDSRKEKRSQKATKNDHLLSQSKPLYTLIISFSNSKCNNFE